MQHKPACFSMQQLFKTLEIVDLSIIIHLLTYNLINVEQTYKTHTLCH